MPDPTCSVAACMRPQRTRTLCHAHYQRFLRSGEWPTSPLRHHEYGRGCVVESCDRAHHTRGYCSTHWRRLVNYGDPDRSKVMPSGPQHWNWSGANIDYKGAHRRIYRKRGAAKAHACVQCGAAARHWAYDHTDPAELTSPAGWPYSLDPMRYQPMCALCHKAFDGAPTSQHRRDPATG